MKSKIYLIFILQICCLTTVKAQADKNVEDFKKSLHKRLQNEVQYYNHNTELFSICIKIDDTGKIENVLISLSTPPELRDRLNVMKADFDYTALLREAKQKKWNNKNIILPVFCLFESSSVDVFSKLTEYVRSRLDNFLLYDLIGNENYVDNCVILKPMYFVATEPVR